MRIYIFLLILLLTAEQARARKSLAESSESMRCKLQCKMFLLKELTCLRNQIYYFSMFLRQRQPCLAMPSFDLASNAIEPKEVWWNQCLQSKTQKKWQNYIDCLGEMHLSTREPFFNCLKLKHSYRIIINITSTAGPYIYRVNVHLAIYLKFVLLE